MNLCHLDFELRWRGGQRQVLLLLEGLARRGVGVTLVTAPDSTLGAKAAEMGIRVEEIPARNELDLRAIRDLHRLVRGAGFDILHAHTSHAHGLAVIVKALVPGVKAVIHRRVDFRPGRDMLNRIKYRRLPDRYIAISHAIARVLVEAGVPRERIEVIHSAVAGMRCVPDARESVRRELRLPEDAILVGNVANLSDHKGHRYLIDAAKILCRENRDVYFVIVGRGELEAALKAQVSGLGLEGRVLFTGFREDVERLMCAFDVFAMTSHLEGLCTSLLDAMSVGVPVVATNAGGIPEIVSDYKNGLLVQSKDPISIAGGLALVLNDPALRARLVAGGMATVRDHFGVDRMVDRTVEVYRKVLDG